MERCGRTQDERETERSPREFPTFFSRPRGPRHLPPWLASLAQARFKPTSPHMAGPPPRTNTWLWLYDNNAWQLDPEWDPAAGRIKRITSGSIFWRTAVITEFNRIWINVF